MYLKVCGNKSFLAAGLPPSCYLGHFFNLAGRLLVEIDLNDGVNHTDCQMFSRAFEVFRN